MPIRSRRAALPLDARVATAGSCFAQNVGKYLERTQLLRLLQVEPIGADQPLFSAQYGNIYTARQLLQLFRAAFRGWAAGDAAWPRADGRFVDPFRPSMFPAGFPDPEAVRAARASHLEAVRRVFADCTVFVFALGLTECWMARADGAVFPVAPGVVSDRVDPAAYCFHNFTYAETLTDMRAFLAEFRTINRSARVLLTVSPVPLTATYTDEHVLVATMHSKSILRAVCSALEEDEAEIFYFPSYEIIVGHHTRGHYYNADLRTVTEAGVDHVMRVFALNFALQPAPIPPQDAEDDVVSAADPDAGIICDEADIVRSIGF